MVELALKTMTTPKASRQSVAVSSSEYSIGGEDLRRALIGQLLHQRAEVLAALLEVAVAVEARAGRRQQHHLARLASAAAAAHGLGEPVAAAVLDPGRPGGLEVALELLGGLADQIAAAAALGDRGRRARRSRRP